MLLLLGKPEAIRKYIKEMSPDIDEYSDVVYYPGKEHYTEFKILIEDLKSDNPPVVTTQNKEFIEYLLESDLDFNGTCKDGYGQIVNEKYLKLYDEKKPLEQQIKEKYENKRKETY